MHFTYIFPVRGIKPFIGVGLVLLAILLLASPFYATAPPVYAEGSPANTSAALDTLDLSRIYGKIQIVDHFADYKVQVVTSFPDLRVQLVEHFPSGPGKWQIVEHFPDYKIQIVTSFPDFKIKYVTSFPGVE